MSNTPNEQKRGKLRVVTQDTRKVQHGQEPGLFEPGEEIAGTNLRVSRVIGTGGFGVVYECDDTELDIPVAVKLLHTTAAASPEAQRVFREESRALAKINSPHVVGVRRFGITAEASPRPFLVMFKLEGHTLLDALTHYGRFDQIDTVVYGIHMAKGLAAAHHAGLVHRDVKLANVFLETGVDPVSGKAITVAKLLDFGIARAASTGAPDSARLPIICSHPYCGPEQYHGRAYPQTDIYSLGVILFLMLTREHPLGNIAADRDWVRAKLVTRPKPQLVNEVIAELNLLRSEARGKIPVVDPELEELIDRCLSYEPADRPGTAEAVVRALELVRERLNAAKEAAEEAKRRQKGQKPGRGAATVPEPPEWMNKRITAEFERSRQAVPHDEPETVQSFREVESKLERSKAIERALLGMTPDHPPLTDSQVAAILAGATNGPTAAPARTAGPARTAKPSTDDVANGVRQQLMLAGSTLESPQAAQRNARKWSTAGARVVFAPDNTPVMEGAPRFPELPPADQDYQHRQKRGFTAAKQDLVVLPLAGPWGWRSRAAAFLKTHVFKPARGQHWRVVAIVVPLAFSLTVVGVVAVKLSLARAPAPAVSAEALPSPSPPAASPAPVPAPQAPVAPSPAASAAEAPHGTPGAPPAVATKATHGGPKSGPGPSEPTTTAPVVSPPVPKAAAPVVPAASCKYCYLIEESSARAPAPPAPSASAHPAPVPSLYISPTVN